jgi:hypothetical protein
MLQFTVISSLIENVAIADEVLLVIAGFRHGALFHDSATILAAILKYESIT